MILRRCWIIFTCTTLFEYEQVIRQVIYVNLWIHTENMFTLTELSQWRARTHIADIDAVRYPRGIGPQGVAAVRTEYAAAAGRRTERSEEKETIKTVASELHPSMVIAEHFVGHSIHQKSPRKSNVISKIFQHLLNCLKDHTRYNGILKLVIYRLIVWDLMMMSTGWIFRTGRYELCQAKNSTVMVQRRLPYL